MARKLHDGKDKLLWTKDDPGSITLFSEKYKGMEV